MWENGCQEIHCRLLHQHNSRTEPSAGNARDHTAPKHVDAGQGQPRALAENPVASVTEGKEQPHAEQTTMMTQNNARADLNSQTVPIILRNGNRPLKVNALLDEASIKMYLNQTWLRNLGYKEG